MANRVLPALSRMSVGWSSEVSFWPISRRWKMGHQERNTGENVSLLRVRFIEGALQLFQLLSGFAELAFLRRW
jgi:hypothetical protein